MSGKQRRGTFKPKAIVGYIRVSTEGQAKNGGSLDDQTKAIKAFATSMDLPLFQIFSDEASGRGADSFVKRDGLQKALQATLDNDAIMVVWSWSRLSRHAAASGDIQKMIDDPKRIRSLDENESFNEATEKGRLAHAQSAAEKQARLTKDGMARKKASGTEFGNPNIGAAQKKGASAMSAKGARTIREVADFLRSLPVDPKLSTSKLAEMLNATGSRTGHGEEWNESRLRVPLGKARALVATEDQSRKASAIPGYGIF